jgi:hypothetical protein
MVTHFTGQNLAHMGPKKPVRESLSIPGPARKNEIAGQQRGAVFEATMVRGNLRVRGPSLPECNFSSTTLDDASAPSFPSGIALAI